MTTTAVHVPQEFARAIEQLVDTILEIRGEGYAEGLEAGREAGYDEGYDAGVDFSIATEGMEETNVAGNTTECQRSPDAAL